MHDTDALVETAIDLGKNSPNVYAAFYDPDSDETLVETILEAVQDATEDDDEVSGCLYDAIDPDALNALFEPTRNGPDRDEGRVAFRLGGFAVDVHASGHVFIRRMS